MKNTLILFTFFLLVLTGCASMKEKQFAHENNTPGAVAINDTLFCDQTEITNFNWMEYMFWIQKCYGKESDEYKSTLPDTTVWKEFTCLDTTYMQHYLRHPAYRSYPVVGITKEQAEDFGEWRSDRVFEYYLIKRGILNLNSHQSRESHFTIARYFNGEYPSDTLRARLKLPKSAPDTSIMYPAYRLPNTKERQIILGYVDSTDYLYHITQSDRERLWLEENKLLQMAITPCTGKQGKQLLEEPTRYVRSGFPDKRNKYNLLYNVRGNVAEWSADKNRTYGGGWSHNVNYVMQNDTITSETPNAWTGFRCVCEWKKWE